MTTLHIVRESAFNTHDFFQCLQVLRNNDVIAFIDDGCYNVHHNLMHNLIDNIGRIDSDMSIKFAIIGQHARARAIKINEEIYTKITMADLVSLSFENDRVITWQ
jgi:tRNA 2-thiouridine synthesizing protein B